MNNLPTIPVGAAVISAWLITKAASQEQAAAVAVVT